MTTDFSNWLTRTIGVIKLSEWVRYLSGEDGSGRQETVLKALLQKEPEVTARGEREHEVHAHVVLQRAVQRGR